MELAQAIMQERSCYALHPEDALAPSVGHPMTGERMHNPTPMVLLLVTPGSPMDRVDLARKLCGLVIGLNVTSIGIDTGRTSWV